MSFSYPIDYPSLIGHDTMDSVELIGVFDDINLDLGKPTIEGTSLVKTFPIDEDAYLTGSRNFWCIGLPCACTMSIKDSDLAREREVPLPLIDHSDIGIITTSPRFI